MTQPEAVAPDQWGEWIEWEGGENPVPGMLVRCRIRRGSEDRKPFKSERARWEHDGGPTDIIAYRVAAQAASVSPGTDGRIATGSETQNNPHPGRGEDQALQLGRE